MSHRARLGHKARESREPTPSEEERGLSDLATPTGLEPATSAVTGRRANQLRYGAKLCVSPRRNCNARVIWATKGGAPLTVA